MVDGWALHVLKPVLLIRSDNNEADKEALGKLGIATLIDPYIDVAIESDSASAEELLNQLEKSPGPLWLLVTSTNALNFWAKGVGEGRLREAIAARADVNFAAVGSESAKTVEAFGGHDVFIPRESTGRALADELIISKEVGHALIPGGNLAMKILPTQLEAADWKVSTAVVYRTSAVVREPSSAQLVRDKEVSAILFRSPSAVRALTHFVVKPDVPLVCAGVTTAAAVEALGLDVAALSPKPSAAVVASTIYSLLS